MFVCLPRVCPEIANEPLDASVAVPVKMNWTRRRGSQWCQRASPLVVPNIENSHGILDKTLRHPSPTVMHDCRVEIPWDEVKGE